MSTFRLAAGTTVGWTDLQIFLVFFSLTRDMTKGMLMACV